MKKKLPKQLQRKAIVDDFCRGSQYERLEGQEGRGFFATQMNFEKRQKEVERVAESKIVLNRHVFVFIFG